MEKSSSQKGPFLAKMKIEKNIVILLLMCMVKMKVDVSSVNRVKMMK